MTRNTSAVVKSAPSRAPASFDYSGTPPDVARFLRGQAERIRLYAGKCIITIGRHLIGVKHYLPHGTFIRWVESEVGISARSAQGYMRAAEWAEGKSATIAHLSPSLLYILSRSSTPESLANDILKRVEAGEEIAVESLRSELRLARAAPRNPRPRVVKLPEDEAHAALTEAVSIMASGLCRSEFVRVKEAMTSTYVLGRADLPKLIMTAFSSTQARPSGEPEPFKLAGAGNGAGANAT